MERGQAKTTDNSEYLAFVRQSYLNRLKGHLPKTVLDKTSWLSPPAVLAEVQRRPGNPANPQPLNTCVVFPLWTSSFSFSLKTSEVLRKLHYRLMVRKYVRGITPQKKTQVSVTSKLCTQMSHCCAVSTLYVCLAPAQVRCQLHLQGQKGELPTECRSAFHGHQNRWVLRRRGFENSKVLKEAKIKLRL